MVSVLGALQRQLSDLKAENLSPKKLSQALMQNAPPGPDKNTGEKFDRLFAKIPTSTLGNILKVDQRLAFWLTREVVELFRDRDTLTRS